MNAFMKIITLPVRAIRHMKRNRFYKRFVNISRESCIGENGIGKGCCLEGDERIVIGKNTFIGTGSELAAYCSHFKRHLDSHLIIGNHVRITSKCRITCAGTIRIGNDALFAPDVFITDHNHGMDPEAPGGYSPQEITISNVTIGEGVWLGQRVCVLPGVTIGDHSIIGANSVVTHDIPGFSIAVGAPARVIKKWSKERKCWETV